MDTIHCQDTREQALALLLEITLARQDITLEQAIALMMGYSTLSTDDLIKLLGDKNDNK